MDRVVSIKITSDGRAFVVDQAANADAAAKFGRQVEEAGKQVEAAGTKVAAVGKNAKEAADGLKRAGDGAGSAGEQFKKSGDGAGAAAPKVRQLGDSAQRTAQQMRQVAPQITDIVTQIAAGQNPMQIFIQQGGQLKDVFGGAGPALRAVGGYVASLISPISVAAVAAGGLAYAFYEGHRESGVFARQLLLSGNAAGATASEYHAMADGLAAVAGTKGAALEAISAIAEAGRVSADQLQRYAGIAQQLDRLVGKPVADTAKEFAALAEAPVEASLKLTQTYNYLTASVYEQIKALKDQGLHTEAAKLAQESFAQAMEDRIPKMQASLGLLERGWVNVKDAIKGAGDAILSIGRVATLGDQIAALKREIEKAKGPFDANAFSGNAEARAKLQANVQLLAVLEQQERSEKRAAFAAADRLVTVQAAARFDKVSEASLDKQEKLRRAIKQIEADGLAGLKTRKQIEDAIANEKKKYQDAPSGLSAAAKDLERQRRLLAELSGVTTTYMDELASLNRLRQQGNLSEERYIALVTELISKQPMAKKLIEEQAKETERLAKADIEAGKAREWHLQQLDKDLDRIEAEIEKEQEHIRSLGLTKEAIAELVAAKLEDQAVSLQLQAIRQLDKNLDEAAYDLTMRQVEALRRLASAKREGAAKEAFLDLTKTNTENWHKFVDNIDATFHDGYMQMLQNGSDGWEAWGDSLVNTFKTTVADEIYKMFVKPIVLNFVSSVFGGGAGSLLSAFGGGGGGGVGGLLNMGSSANSAYNLFNNGFSGLTAPGSAYYNFATSAFGQSVGLSNAAPIIGNNISAYAPAGTQLAGSEAIGAIAPYAAILAPIFAAWADGMFNGETRSGAQYGYSFDGSTVANPRRGTTLAASGVGAALLEGPSGGDPAADASKLIVNSTVASINAAMAALGTGATLTAFQAAYETSDKSRGGVFAGGTFNTGVSFGESGRGDNYDHGFDPNRSLYEVWGTDSRGANMSGSPEALAIDAAQSYIEAIQASVGLIPQIVKEQFTYQTPSGVGGEEVAQTDMVNQTGDRWVRVFDEAMRQSVKDLGLLPKRIADLIVDIDPEALSDAATTEIATKIQALVTNVNGFHAIVDALPVEALKNVSFDIAAGLVEASGGLEQFGANLTSFVENFYSADEKREFIIGNITRTLEGVGLSLDGIDLSASDARAQFRDLAESIDRTTEEGQKQYATVLQVAGAYASVTADVVTGTGSLEQALARLRNPMRDIEEIAGSIIRLESDTAALRVQLLRAQGSGGSADALQRSLDTAGLTAAEIAIYDYNAALRLQIGAIEDANARVDDAVAELARAREVEADSLRTQLDALTGSSSALRRFAQDLRAFRDSLLLGQLSPLTPGEKLAEASRQFESVYAAALAGDETALGQLQGVSQEFLEASQLYNASSTAYLADFARVQTALTLTATAADAQAESSEDQVALLRSQLTALESLGQSSVSGTLTVAGAIENLRLAVLAAQGLGTAVGGDILDQVGLQPSPVDAAYNSANTQIRALYSSAIGVNNPDSEGLKYWTQRLLSGVSIAQLTLEMQESAKFIRGYASGGLASGLSLVGEKGPELVDFGTPARVYTAQQTAGMFGSNDALLDEVRGLRQELRALKEQVRAGTGEQIDALMATSEQNAQRTGELVGQAVSRGAFERKNAREAALA